MPFSEALLSDHPLKEPLGAISNPKHTPLFTACVFGLSHLIEDISRTRHFNCNQRNDLGATGLYLVSWSGYKAIAWTLINHGGDVNAIGGKYSNPLHAACYAGHINIVRLLLDHEANPYASGMFDNALQASFLGDHEKVTQLLLKDGVEILNQHDYNSSLQQAAQAGFVDVMQLLQKKDA